jgi:hypothetical protein
MKYLVLEDMLFYNIQFCLRIEEVHNILNHLSFWDEKVLIYDNNFLATEEDYVTIKEKRKW